jgi:hypothetical protein
MRTITHNQVQELVRHLPAAKLKRVYNMILELEEKRADTDLTQLDFMKLPLSERQKIMKQQARKMAMRYKKTAVERNEWQSGDFIDET